jgi:hypothetical protein
LSRAYDPTGSSSSVHVEAVLDATLAPVPFPLRRLITRELSMRGRLSMALVIAVVASVVGGAADDQSDDVRYSNPDGEGRYAAV